MLFGTGTLGLSVALAILIVDGLVALACSWRAFRHAHDIAAIFWFLFVITLGFLIVPVVFQVYDTIFAATTLSDTTRSLLYCFYGVPILMMLFLPDSYGRERVRFEIFLDLFQIAIVVSLIYSTFIFLPVQGMLPAEALRNNVIVSDEQSCLLLVATFLRMHFAKLPGTRDLLRRLSYFLLVCAAATLIGDRIDLHQSPAASAWFNLGWAIPLVIAGFLALTWKPSARAGSIHETSSFFGFLSTNLLLVTMLAGTHLLIEHWKTPNGKLITSISMAASLLAFAFRLALTQFHQQREIFERKATQQRLTASNEQVSHLLQDARRQTDEITQISELGSLLQACASREEVFRLVPERLRRLFPGTSGCVALISSSRNRVESVAEWGISPNDQLFSPDECWSLRRGCVHAHPKGFSATRCSHLVGEGASVCLPLIANGETIGTLAIQNQENVSPSFQQSITDPAGYDRKCQVAAAVGEHLALSIANLNLREALRVQAVRDPLTGLYNRRYMQEFLDRELHSARRRRRPLSVMMLDLDHFKRYNDSYGHAAGDKALAAIGETLLRSIRADDIACRYGGEEFSLIFPECSLEQAAWRADEIRAHVREIHLENDGIPATPLTVSIGVAAFDETTDRVDLLLKFADDALYEAKRNGRDRVVSARPVPSMRENAPPEIARAIAASNPAK